MILLTSISMVDQVAAKVWVFTGRERLMNLARILSFAAAVLFVLGAIANKVFYFGRMGGGASERRMPTWLARAILAIGALAFAYYALVGSL